MNEITKPDRCNEPSCTNKCYGKNYLTPLAYEWLCRKHYFLCVYGLDYPRETVKYPEGRPKPVKIIKHKGFTDFG